MSTSPNKFSSSLADSVQKGFTDGSNYDAYRPNYTDEATNEVKRMLYSDFQYDSSMTVLELGAGTGKFTQKITAKLNETVTYIATEPMSDFLKILKKNCPKVETRQCATENLPIDDGSIKCIVAAQSFHWFSTKTSLDEMHRVLAENGNVVLLWNFNDRNVDWINQLLSRIDRNRTDPCRYHGKEWKTAIDAHPGFMFVDQKIAQGQIFKGDVEFMLRHCSTHSGLQKLEEKEKEKELDEIRQILTTHPETKGKDTIEFPFFTDIYLYRKVVKSNQRI
ncbi:unnamed protein product [Mytilus coruscus]|uniref:Methyltransferase domain-containing protein n=1 Tax=Mytilus coruscus TaxID=42192 RepID=A0A6J8E8U4_MYTCO|nr:unnamed protein product [Mytilus coruscus]